jgi:nitrate/nitrite transporter NarK
MPAATARPVPILAGGFLLGLSVGSLYAWSLFYRPIETDLGIGRAWLSGAFSLASLMFAVSMVAGPYLFRGWPAWRVALLSGAMAGAGLLLPGLTASVPAIVIGYGLLYGTACGFAYCVALQCAVLAMPRRIGLAAGIVAVAGASGSIAGALIFGEIIAALGPWRALTAIGAAFLAFGLCAAIAMRGAVMPSLRRDGAARNEARADRVVEFKLWLGFLFGASAGLTALGHAAGIAAAYGGPAAPLGLATAGIALGNLSGRMGGGWIADLVPVRRSLTVAPLIAAALLAALAAWPSLTLALAALLLTGLAYGILAATYPAAVARYFGAERTGVVYGRVFTAWGVAGFVVPGFAGYLFDRSGSYGTALSLAALCALLSSAAAATLPRR